MATEVTVKELDDLIQKYVGDSEVRDGVEMALAEMNKNLNLLLGKITAHLKELDREEYDSPFGKVVLQQKWRVNLPQDDNAKRALFEHLRERGIFDKYATVNSNSLNALYMRDWEEAKERGEAMTFNMPGIDAPKLFETSKVKLKKKG